jgi:hypothetical protein
VNGKAKASRGDYTASDDAQHARAGSSTENHKNAIGYVG